MSATSPTTTTGTSGITPDVYASRTSKPLTLDAAQLARNRQSADHLALDALGLRDKPRSDWSYDERNQFNKKMADFILKYPQRFSPSDLARAAAAKSANYQPLDNADFSWSDFGSELLNNVVAAGNKVGDVGRGVVDAASNLGKGLSNTSGVVGKLLPIVAVIGIAIVLFALAKRTGAA